MTPPIASVPAPGLAANASTMAWACAIASGVGVNTSLMIGICAGWIAIFAAKAVAACRLAIAAETVVVAKVDIDGIDRRHPGGGRAGEAERARQPVGIEISAVGVAVGLGAELGGQIFGAPGQRAKAACSRRHKCRRGTSDAAVSVAIGMILIWPSGRPFCGLAHRELGVGMDDGRAAFRFRQHDGVGPARRDRVEIGVGQAGMQAVDAHDEIRPRPDRRSLL